MVTFQETEYVEISEGDIVQIVDQEHPWFPALLIVNEVKNWGVQAVVLIPKTNDGSEPVGQAHNRLPFNVIEKVGRTSVRPS